MVLHRYILKFLIICHLVQNAWAGDCNHNNVIGSNNSIDCSNREKLQTPDHMDAVDQIKNYNKFPIYNIESVDYLNGYSSGNTKYVVVASVNVQTKLSCEQMGSNKGMPRGGDMQEAMTILAVGLAAIKFAVLFGSHCRAGDKFSLVYQDEFQHTENGWVLINQETVRAEKR